MFLDRYEKKEQVMNFSIYKHAKIETSFILTIHRYKEFVSRMIDHILNMITNID
jgi:hypothetical protein